MSAWDPSVVGMLPILLTPAHDTTRFTLAPFAPTADTPAGQPASAVFFLQNVGSWLNPSIACAYTQPNSPTRYVTMGLNGAPAQRLVPDTDTATAFRFLLQPSPSSQPSWGQYSLQLQGRPAGQALWQYVVMTFGEVSSDQYNVSFALSPTLDDGNQPSRWGIMSTNSAHMMDFQPYQTQLDVTVIDTGTVMLLYQSAQTVPGNNFVGFPLSLGKNLVNMSVGKQLIASNGSTFKKGAVIPLWELWWDKVVGDAGDCQVGSIGQVCQPSADNNPNADGFGFACAQVKNDVAVDDALPFNQAVSNWYFSYDMWYMEISVVDTDLDTHLYVAGSPPPLIAGNTPPPPVGPPPAAPVVGPPGPPPPVVIPPSPVPTPAPAPAPDDRVAGLTPVAWFGIFVGGVVIIIIIIVVAAVQGTKAHKRKVAAAKLAQQAATTPAVAPPATAGGALRLWKRAATTRDF